MHLLTLGHGYTAQALARRVRAAGGTVTGTTRTPEHAAALRAQGWDVVVWPGTDLAPLLARATHVLVSMAPGEAGDPLLAADRAAFAGARLDWLGYLSTTAVYGDHDGAWVDEDTPLTPSTRRGAQRVAAETAWRALAAEAALPLHIFRLAGIYGPGRGPFEKVREGTARRILKPGQVFSRIHVEDIATALMASIAAPSPGSAYNLCDDDPAPPEDVIAHAATLLGLPLPPAVDFATAEMTPMARSFYMENKRVRNDRMKRLGFTLAYPTYREGLAALLAAEAE
ncbi:SDR family oxidoreductase [Frigidibacter sp. MR17.14]|uniref:SDR family oxidoreductase n=1 Tax=Frigidibacter sp. MR17.14 TaxID=3126509 RepID=UPI003FA5BC84